MSIRRTIHCFITTLIILASSGQGVVPAEARQAGRVVISEVYGGGGNSGSTFTHDFIELYNPTTSDVAMWGWSIQYQSGSGSGKFTVIGTITGTIRARRYFLVRANPGSGGTTPLPTPDAEVGITLAAASGKVALVSDTLGVSGPGDSTVVDFVGYGSANLYEGSGPAVAPGNTLSIERKASSESDSLSMCPGGEEEGSGNGFDSDDNEWDFIRRGPQPQNDGSGPEIPPAPLSLDAFYDRGWNLVSVPLAVADPSAGGLFPGSVSLLYAYDAGYSAESLAVWGRGYWVRFAETESVSFTGSPTASDTVRLSVGWNLVGAPAALLPAAGVISVPPGDLGSAFFTYRGGYEPADTLRPGRAYWVRSLSGGLLILRAGEQRAPGTAPPPEGVGLPPAPPGGRMRTGL